MGHANDDGHLVFAIATTSYIVLAIQLEERHLVAAYASYRQRVPMLMPRLRKQPVQDRAVTAGFSVAV